MLCVVFVRVEQSESQIWRQNEVEQLSVFLSLDLRVNNMAAIHFVVSLVLCVLCAEAKMVVMRKSISKKDNWVFISKFAFDVGVGSLDYVVKESTGTRADNKADAHMYFYLDEDWPQVLAAKTCEEKTKVAKAKFPAHVDHKRTVSQFIRPHVWYVVMANCDSDLKMYPRQVFFFSKVKKHYSFIATKENFS